MAVPTLRQLRYLVTLCETRNFSRAAEQCHVTQSTLSGGIQDLEGLVGFQLFERGHRRVIATPAALDLAERARRILAETEGFVEAAAAHADESFAPVRLGLIPTIGPFLLPQLLAAIRPAHPRLKLVLREDHSARLLERLAAGDLDAVVLAFPYDCPGTETRLFVADPFWVALPPGHPLAAKDSVTPADIAAERLLLLEDGHCLREHVLDACALGEPAEGIQGTSLYTLLQMVADGLGVTVVPDMARDSPMLAGLDVVYRPLPPEVPARRIGLVWRPSSGRKGLFRDLAELCEKALGNKGGALSP
ncbi:hydrogen peroxide-inducible genes activator [Magnetospirillum sp. UT-4]|uniref:hydrogen peroxide-inducible genes activator n=1 Tax=Magnetospirillum sp. UT-4 TaxID=2681467 RepID=UPI0013856540|nr:hydrogen peroxide-inducible genes activator [Magnetospirillum sp. UT-4]CAA7627077.1 Hydrogen peroxide-inducible genes activator [Magnetospirillum sp. UT-4]